MLNEKTHNVSVLYRNNVIIRNSHEQSQRQNGAMLFNEIKCIESVNAQSVT